MKTTKPRIALAALLVLAVLPHETRSEPRGNKLEVRLLEAAYRLESETLRVRVTLVTGEALEFEAKPGSIEAILKMAEILGDKRGRMFAEVQEHTVRALQVAVP
jgi:hypothetical protein